MTLSNAITSRKVIENSLVLGLFLVTFLLNNDYMVVENAKRYQGDFF